MNKKNNKEILKKRLEQTNFIGKYNFAFINKNYELLSLVKEARKNKSHKLKIFFKNRLALFSLILFLSTIFLALVIPLTTQSPTQLNPALKHAPALTSGHILGTDLAGRDLWARLWHGLRFSLGLAAVATFVDIFLGVILGLLMGYFAFIDRFFQFIIKVITNVPQLFLLTLFVLFWNPTFWVLAFSMIFTGWIAMAQYTRSEILRYKVMEYTIAEKTLGFSAFKIIKGYIPSLVPIIITQLVFTVPIAIQYDASLALIGLAVPNVASIGNMISNSTSFITIHPLEALFPILVMTSIIIYVQFIGNGIEVAIRGDVYAR